MSTLMKKFEKMGARIQVRKFEATRRWRRNNDASDFSIDILRGRNGECFDILLDGAKLEDFNVVQVDAKKRHLLLQKGNQKFLCGHDERHWFVAGVASHASTIEHAKEILKPDEAKVSQSRKRVKNKKRNKRKNDGFVRQGEWFFIPEPDKQIKANSILPNEPLRRGAGKPHFAQELYRCGGVNVYVDINHPNGLTESEWNRLCKKDPSQRNGNWQQMSRNPEVYVRGKIRHADHKTLLLPFWHKVVVNREVMTKNVAFLD